MFSVILGNSLMKCERSIFDRGSGSSVVLTAPKYGFQASRLWGLIFSAAAVSPVNISRGMDLKNSVIGFGIESKLRHDCWHS